MAGQKTFYLETFGCQMNVHDSEKVIGTLEQQGYTQVETPYVSLVSGSASYRRLPEMLVQIEQGATRVTGLDDRQTDETFETEFTARSNPHRGYITIIEGCDKFCAYCVVPYTRGKERSRKSDSVLTEARRMADAGFTEIQLLGQNTATRTVSGPSQSCSLPWARSPASAACASQPPIRETLRGTSLRPSTPCPRCAITCICRCRAAHRRYCA